jgi:ubiquinone/menaquinone biosynthesis C-methylase UbiE
MSRCFDSDTNALRQRERINADGALHNLEMWITQQVNPYRGMRILDLGCGTGKQIFHFAPLVFSEGHITGIDLSDEAVGSVKLRAEREGLDNIETLKGSIDDCLSLLQGRVFDLILSAYAIYYSRDLVGLLSKLRVLLRAKGQVFVCGYGRGTNQEMIRLVNQIAPGSQEGTDEIQDFLREPEIREIGKWYSRHRTVRLDNRITFTSAESVLRWWRNHNSFIADIYEEVARAIEHHFEINEAFILTKAVLGIQFYEFSYKRMSSRAI